MSLLQVPESGFPSPSMHTVIKYLIEIFIEGVKICSNPSFNTSVYFAGRGMHTAVRGEQRVGFRFSTAK